jgi:hypothetical protein
MEIAANSAINRASLVIFQFPLAHGDPDQVEDKCTPGQA